MPDIALLADLLALLLGGIAFVHWGRARESPLVGMGLTLDAWAGVEALAGIAIGTLAMGGIFAVEAGLGLLRVQGVGPPDSVLVGLLGSLALAAFGEELLFRSLMLTGLRVVLRNTAAAVVVMATVFGLAHAGNPDASALSVLGNALGGLQYGVAFAGSRRIWLPWGLHLAWNFVQGPLLGFPVSGLALGGLVHQVVVGGVLFTGGAYGPEAGLVGIAFRFVVLLLLAIWLRRRAEYRVPSAK